MKIIAFAEESVNRNYVPYLNKKGVKVFCISNLFQDILMHDKQPPFDLAIVESDSGDAAIAYHYFSKIWSIPIIFLVDNKWQEWDGIKSLSPAGYIPKKAGPKEFFTRLIAISRRVSVNNNAPAKIKGGENASSRSNSSLRYLTIIAEEVPQSINQPYLPSQRLVNASY